MPCSPLALSLAAIAAPVHARSPRLELPGPQRVGVGGGWRRKYDVIGSSELMVWGQSWRTGVPGHRADMRAVGWPSRAGVRSREPGMIAKAHCIGTHGVPNFPDPFVGAGGGIGCRRPAGYNIPAPAFQQAKKACANVETAILGAGVG